MWNIRSLRIGAAKMNVHVVFSTPGAKYRNFFIHFAKNAPRRSEVLAWSAKLHWTQGCQSELDVGS